MSSSVSPEHRTALHTRLKTKAEYFKAVTDLGEISLRTAEIILQLHPPNLSADKSEIVKTVRESFPPLNQIFNDELISNPLLPISLLEDVLEFYNVSPITPNFLAKVDIQDITKTNWNVAILVSLSALFGLPEDRVKPLCSAYLKSNDVDDSNWMKETVEINVSRNNNENSQISNQTTDALNSSHQHSLSNPNREMGVTQNNLTPEQFNTGEFSYSNIGAIPRLPINRSTHQTSSANVNGRFRAFTHPTSKFSGLGSMHENLGTFHQSYINTVLVRRLT